MIARARTRNRNNSFGSVGGNAAQTATACLYLEVLTKLREEVERSEHPSCAAAPHTLTSPIVIVLCVVYSGAARAARDADRSDDDESAEEPEEELVKASVIVSSKPLRLFSSVMPETNKIVVLGNTYACLSVITLNAARTKAHFNLHASCVVCN